MAVVSYALTTLAEVKLLLGITETTYDALLEGLINSSTDLIENFCGRRFIETIHTEEEMDGNGSKSLFIKYFPLTELTLLEHRTGKVTWETVDEDNYRINFDTSEIQLDCNVFENRGWREGFRNYRATYKAGFVTIPHDLNMACQQMVANEYNSRGTHGEISSESLGDYSVKYVVGGNGGDRFIDGTLSLYKKKKV